MQLIHKLFKSEEYALFYYFCYKNSSPSNVTGSFSLSSKQNKQKQKLKNIPRMCFAPGEIQ